LLHQALHSGFGDFGFKPKGGERKGRGEVEEAPGGRNKGANKYGGKEMDGSLRGKKGDAETGSGDGGHDRRHKGRDGGMSGSGGGKLGSDGGKLDDKAGSLPYVMARQTGWLSSTAWVVVLGGIVVLAVMGVKTLRSGGLSYKMGGQRAAEMRQR
jgi:hypothetical protein